MRRPPEVVAVTARAVVVTSAALTLSCSVLLGGLEDGTARHVAAADAAPPPPPPEAATPTCRTPWLPGYAYRTPFAVQNDGPALAGYSLALGLDSKMLVDEGRMRADGADIRIVGADGVTVAPYWVASGMNGEATHLWAKVDVPSGTSQMVLYHGKPDAQPTASLASTFVEGIVANGHFDLGSVPWVAFTPSDGTYKLEIDDGVARMSVQRDPSTTKTALGFCQRVVFPEGAYRLVFDHNSRDAGLAYLAFWVGGIGGRTIWRGKDRFGPRTDEETDLVSAGETELCFGIELPPSAPYRQGLTADVSNVRVRVARAVEPVAGEPGPPEPQCTP